MLFPRTPISFLEGSAIDLLCPGRTTDRSRVIGWGPEARVCVSTYVLSVLLLRNRLFEHMRLRINHGICGQAPSSHGGNVHVVLLGFWTDVAALTGVFNPRLAYAVDCCLSPRPLASLLLAVSISKRFSIIFTAKSQFISYWLFRRLKFVRDFSLPRMASRKLINSPKLQTG